MIKNSTIGLRPSRLDIRDYRYLKSETPLQEQVDLREWDSIVEQQGYLGSCAAHAVTSAYELMVKNQHPDKFTDLSRLFVYYNTRVIENSVTLDMGVYEIRNVLKAISQLGVCREDLWPYWPSNLLTRPSKEAYEDAKLRTISKYWSLFTLSEMLDSISNIKPIVIGLEIYSSFQDVGSDGLVPMPRESEVSEGGHAMTIVGYDQQQQTFTAKNSFGTSWGDNGYCYLPWEYVRLYVFEKWVFDIDVRRLKPIL